MANVNINAGAAGNPLDALLQQNGGSLWGNTGFNIEQLLANARAGTIDPRLAAMGYGPTSYDSTYQFNPSDQNISGATGDITINGTAYHQLASTSIGGQGQPIDPSKVIYDPKYGLLTPQSNLKPISNGYGDMVFALASLGLGLPTAAAALGGSAATTAGTTGTAGTGGTSLASLGIDASPITVTPLGSVPAMASTDGILGTSGLLGSAGGLLGQAGSWAMAHPLQAAGLAQTAYGLLGGGRSSAPGGGGSSKGGGGGSLGTQGIQQKFYVNPVTQAQLQRYQGGLL